MNRPTITNKQRTILHYLYKFHYLDTKQFQILFHHKDPHRIKEWLRELKDNRCIQEITWPENKFITNSRPKVYALDINGRYWLRKDAQFDVAELKRVYKESDNSETFILHHLFIADVYLFLLTQKEENETVHFFTKADLLGYTYFPKELPDAYIAIEGEDDMRRYFLTFFDPLTPDFVMRDRVKAYTSYARSSTWEENTDNALFPAILLIFSNEGKKQHILHFTKGHLKKIANDTVSFFVTTKNQIIYCKDPSKVWKAVA